MFLQSGIFAQPRAGHLPHEQAVLRSKRIAIADLDGVGGSHLLTLTRLGIGAFHIADFDTFDLANFNRQAGATVSTLGQGKLEVMTRQTRDINPELEIKGFADGVTADNLSAFPDGVDRYDGTGCRRHGREDYLSLFFLT